MNGGAADAAVTSDATVVWIAPAPPRVGEERAIAAWAQAKRLQLFPPADVAYPALPSDPRIDGTAAAIDERLARARDAITARDGAAADSATAMAEETVLRHPELPNAAWLLAEVLRTKATRLRRVAPADPGQADRLWQRADALDGGRVPGVGEEPAATPPAPATLVFDGAPDGQIWLDGRPVEPGPVPTKAGPHAIVAVRKDAPIWAGWVEAPPGTSVVPLPHYGAPPCSRADFATVEVRDGSVAAAGVQCGAWVAATVVATATVAPPASVTPDAVRIAVCEGAVCGPLREFRHRADWASTPDWVAARAHAMPPRWPAWATWTLAAAGVAAASVIAVVASSASSGPAETRFVSGGLKQTP
ncbi:MAG TPA: hypothetical protein VK841_08980 [Polyangiaceae bacterium]|nr:hypothetical protein [Polyangiaceae bacterium]